ncbi:hypothetical protein Pint_33836 [Pistacia integerrima]|uniref:Uncharacterized protein n=1 Tax=Pistacia integerrima TaxID=434235 RepID=A0ACC0X636_9ROSI|nr:hypothetical protein Pint_33836 [Pistacia integerrima]
MELKEHGELFLDHLPEVYHFDCLMSLIGMPYLEPHHIILRKGLVAGIEYPLLAEHMSKYMARTLLSHLFFTVTVWSTNVMMLNFVEMLSSAALLSNFSSLNPTKFMHITVSFLLLVMKLRLSGRIVF